MSSSISPVDSDAAILSRLIEPELENLVPEVARYLLNLDFGQSDRDRMEDLAAKARAGILTPAEQHEAESYERIGHLMALWRSKARKSLKTGYSVLRVRLVLMRLSRLPTMKVLSTQRLQSLQSASSASD